MSNSEKTWVILSQQLFKIWLEKGCGVILQNGVTKCESISGFSISFEN